MLVKKIIIILFILFLSCAASAETLALPECFRRAAAANPDLRTARHDANVAREDVSLARSSYLPRLDLQGAYTAQNEAQALEALGSTFEMQEADYGSFQLALTQTLYDFGKTSSRYRKTEALREAAEFDYKGREQDVFLQVVKAYYGIWEAKKILATAENEVLQMTWHAQVAKDFYEQEVATLNDLLQAEVKLAASQQQKLAATNRIENMWLRLNYLINRPPEYRAELEADQDGQIEPAELEGEKVLDSRAEIKAMERLVESSRRGVEEIKALYAPEVFARLALDYMQNDRVREQSIASASLGLKMNLFDGGGTTSRYRRAVEIQQQNEARLQQLKEQIALEYRTAVNDLRIAAERVRVTEKAIEQGEENLRITRNRYQDLVGTATEVIDAQTLLTQVRTDNYRARFDYRVALARVKKAMGKL